MSEKFLAIHDWDDHQSAKGDMKWLKVYCYLEDKPKHSGLTLLQQGLLVGLWRLRARTGQNIPNDPAHIARALHVTPKDRPHLPHAIHTLTLRKFLVLTNQQVGYTENDRLYKQEKDNTPKPPVVENPAEATSPSPEMHVAMTLAEFDGDFAFRDLCKVHPRAELDQDTVQIFRKRVQDDAVDFKIPELDAYLRIYKAAEEYHRLAVAGKLHVVYGLQNWLRKGIYRQKPEMWCGGDRGKPALVKERPLSLPERHKLEEMGADMRRPVGELRKLLEASRGVN